jgi:hypothetical protein
METVRSLTSDVICQRVKPVDAGAELPERFGQRVLQPVRYYAGYGWAYRSYFGFGRPYGGISIGIGF